MTDPQQPEQVVPVHRERMSVEIRPVERSRVRVSTEVVEHEELVREALTREDVEIHRVLVGRPVETRPPVRREGDTLILPLVEETLVVERRLVLREELHIVTRSHTAEIEQPVTLRSERAVVERIDLPGAGNRE